jgi:electron transfer DM13
MRKSLLLIFSHIAFAGVGFIGGIYALPILMAPDAPDVEDVAVLESSATYTGEFSRDRKDSDFLHWGEGVVYLNPEQITFSGKLAPGPAYRLYLSPQFVETESAFEELKPQMVEIGPVETFDNFILAVPDGVDLSQFDTVIVWCESFSQFITSARYR